MNFHVFGIAKTILHIRDILQRFIYDTYSTYNQLCNEGPTVTVHMPKYKIERKSQEKLNIKQTE